MEDKRVSGFGSIKLICYCGNVIDNGDLVGYDRDGNEITNHKLIKGCGGLQELYCICPKCQGSIMLNRAELPVIDCQYDCEERKLLARKGNRKV